MVEANEGNNGSKKGTGSGFPERLGTEEPVADLSTLADVSERGRKRSFEGLDLRRLFTDLGLNDPKSSRSRLIGAMRETASHVATKEASIEPTPARTVSTRAVIDSLLSMKRHKRVKDSTIRTYEKKLRQFERRFPQLPIDPQLIIDYLDAFTGATGRHRRNHQDLIAMLYEHATKRFGIPNNPMLLIERTMISTRPIRTLSLAQVSSLLRTPDNLRDTAALELLIGHGWRQVEVRRVLVGDVRAMTDDLIEVDGKERRELAPVMPSTAAKLRQLAEGLTDGDYVIAGRQTDRGGSHPLGDEGMEDLIRRLYDRARIIGMAGHDLRRSFATLVTAAGADHFLSMRLLRDRIPGVGDRYIRFPMDQLVAALKQYSPLVQVAAQHGGVRFSPPAEGGPHEAAGAKSSAENAGDVNLPRIETAKMDDSEVVEAGESRTPRPREAPQDLLQA